MTDLHEVLIFAGPHGAGKDTIEQAFTASRPDTARHVRYSSRPMAPGEVQGQTYNFVSPDEFDVMVEQDAFIDYDRYPEGSSGIAYQDLMDDVQGHRFTAITTNVEEGLSLADKLDGLSIPSRSLFISPRPQDVTLANPDIYLGALARRMAQRARVSDDIVRRLGKAEFYLKLFVGNQDRFTYITNEDGEQDAALEQVQTAIDRV